MTIATPKALIFNLLRKVTGTIIDPDNFEMSPPITLTDGGPYNTKIIFRAKVSGGRYAEQSLKYNRIDISNITGITVKRNGAIRMSDLLEEISKSAQFDVSVDMSIDSLAPNMQSLIMQLEDIVDDLLPPAFIPPTIAGITFSYRNQLADSPIIFNVDDRLDILLGTVDSSSDKNLSVFERDNELLAIPTTLDDPGVNGILSFWFNAVNGQLRLKGMVKPSQSSIALTTLGKGLKIANTANDVLTSANFVLQIHSTNSTNTYVFWAGPGAYSTPYIAYPLQTDLLLCHPGFDDQRPVIQWTNSFGAYDFIIHFEGMEDSQFSNTDMELRINNVLIATFSGGVGTYQNTHSLLPGDKVEAMMTAITDGSINYGGGAKYITLTITRAANGQVWDALTAFKANFGNKVAPWDYFYRDSPVNGLGRHELTAS